LLHRKTLTHTGDDTMLTGTTFEAIAILALIAVVHTIVSTFIATRLAAGEKSDTMRVSATTAPAFGRTPANDQLAKAA
jgi:hypothetical protein